MAQTAALDSAPARGAHPGLWTFVALLCAVYAVATLDRLVIVLLIPGVKASFAISDTKISLLNGAAFGVCNAIALVACGPLADRFERRKLLMLGTVGWSLATLACGLSHSFVQLLTARIMLGMFQGAVGPAALSLAADAAPPQLRGRAMALVLCGGTLGGALANFVGGGLLQMFQAKAPIALPLIGALAPWQSVLVACSAPGLLLAPVLLAVKEPTRHAPPEGPPFRFPAYLKDHLGVFILMLAMTGLFMLAGYANANWGAVLLLRNLHMPPVQVGLTLGVIALVGAAVGAVLGGQLSDLFARRDPNAGRLKLLLLLLPLTALAALPMTAVGHPAAVIGAFAVSAIAATMASSTAATIFSELTPSEGRGQAMALYGLVGTLCGMGVAPTLVALLTDQLFHDEGKLPLSLVSVITPSLLLAALFAALALRGAGALRAQARRLEMEA
jgi:MFS family permease